MRGFGWVAGVEPCDYLGDASVAAFTCVLLMPWARPTEAWTGEFGDAPSISQADCEAGFADWLAPWKAAAVRWQLWSGSGLVWSPLPNAAPLPVAPAPFAPHAVVLRERSFARLGALVADHTDAMGFMVQGERGQRLSYPVVSPGIALRPAALSEQVLGVSAVMTVPRAALAADALVVALPVFEFTDGTLVPVGLAGIEGGSKRFSYGHADGSVAAPRTAARQAYIFNGCVVNEATTRPEKTPFPPQPLRITGGLPPSQMRATLSRTFYPLRLWLDALDGPEAAHWSGHDFCAILARLIGGGEDEMDGGVAVGSIYELILTHDEFAAAFDVRSNTEHRRIATTLATAFDQKLRADTSGTWLAGIFGAMAGLMTNSGLASSEDHSAALVNGAVDGAPASPALLAAARSLQSLLSSQSFTSCAAWCCWFSALTPDVLAAYAIKDSLAPGLAKSATQTMNAKSAQASLVLADDVLRLMNGQIDYAAGFWEAIHAATDLRQALQDKKDMFVHALAMRAGMPAASEPRLAAAYDAAIERLIASLPEYRPEADDSPLSLTYSATTLLNDEKIRGFILALRAGVPGPAGIDWFEGQWLTTFRAALPPPAGNDPVYVKDLAGTVDLVFCDTQGGTKSDGLRENVSPYAGRPLLAAPMKDLPAWSSEVYVPMPLADPVPALGFGIYYGGLAGTVDNAGAIMEKLLRDPELKGKPVGTLAPDLFPVAEPEIYHYLSCQPPGHATFSGADDWGVAEETLAFELLKAPDETFKAVVLFGGANFRKDSDTQSIRLLAPSVSHAFMARWLAADAFVAPGHDFRWERVKNATAAELVELVNLADPDNILRTRNARTKLGLTHPGVKHLKVTVTWYDGTGTLVTINPPLQPIELPLRHLNGKQWLRDEGFEMRVSCVGINGKPTAQQIPTGVEVHVPRGMRARIDARPVLEPRHVTGTYARLQQKAFVNPAHGPYAVIDGEYVTLRPETLWIESLPDVDETAGFDADDFELVLPGMPEDPPEMRLRFKGNLAATWLRGFSIEQKRWQWSGYPIDFPNRTDLKSWLPLYAGTTNEAPALPPATFSTKAGWRIDGVVMQPVPLSATRPPVHMGVELTPIRRFASLLKPSLPPLPTAFLYNVLKGTPHGPSDRLPPPLWDEAIPLPHTVAATESATGLGNGNLLILRDSLYDTADAAAFGGIGERIELDVVSTWQDAIREAGPNPIFHGNMEPNPAPANAATISALDFVLELPFGLPYDLGIGGRPAQTGVIVRPKNARGRWVMAKCRLRRVVLPDQVMDSALAPGGIGWRQVEKEWVPQDFAAYASGPLTQIRVGNTVLKLPLSDGAWERTYLVSWHKERWNGAVPTWHAQVNLYRREPESASWTFVAQASGHVQDTFACDTAPTVPVALDAAGASSLHAVQVSDYTDARWLTFIGSFGLAETPDPDDFELKTDGATFVLDAKPGKKVELPTLVPQGNTSASMLLVYSPGRDLMRGSIAEEGGELIGVYGFSAARGVKPGRFDLAVLACPANTDWDSCHGVVIQMQSVNDGLARPAAAPGEDPWTHLMDEIFPPEEPTAREASRRFLPEFIAPLQITSI